MPTSTFDKNIVIDDEAADRLIAILNKPAPPCPDVSGKFRELTEEDDRCCLQNRLARPKMTWDEYFSKYEADPDFILERPNNDLPQIWTR